MLAARLAYMDIGKCPYCGQRFRRIKGKQKYCSPEHMKAAAKQRRLSKAVALKGDVLPAPYVWIYQIWSEDQCLYVGKARGLKARLTQHANQFEPSEGSRAWSEHVDVVANIHADPELAAHTQLKPKYGRP